MVVPGVLHGTGTLFRTELNKPRQFLFFPGLTPPLLLRVNSFTAKDYGSNPNGNPPTLQGEDIAYVENAPALATIVAAPFQIVSATLKMIRLYNKGAVTAQLDGAIGGSTGSTIKVGQTVSMDVQSQTQNSPNLPKDAHWVDATGTTVEIYEQP